MWLNSNNKGRDHIQTDWRKCWILELRHGEFLWIAKAMLSHAEALALAIQNK